MARLLGVDIPNRKKVGYSLRYIYGVGPTHAKEILDAVEIDSNRRTQDLTEQELSLITNYIIDNNDRKVISGAVSRFGRCAVYCKIQNAH